MMREKGGNGEDALARRRYRKTEGRVHQTDRIDTESQFQIFLNRISFIAICGYRSNEIFNFYSTIFNGLLIYQCMHGTRATAIGACIQLQNCFCPGSLRPSTECECGTKLWRALV
jgi:hypothetical protein